MELATLLVQKYSNFVLVPSARQAPLIATQQVCRPAFVYVTKLRLVILGNNSDGVLNSRLMFIYL